MYADHETRISRQYLETVLDKASAPVCILGGWGVWFLVNSNYKSRLGREYAYSRDIDIGFHTNPNWSDAELRESSFGRTLRALIGIGFKGQGFRLYREFHAETGEALSEREARATLAHLRFPLYVDMMVDRQHPRSQALFGFVAADEERLTLVFDDGECTAHPQIAKLLVPKPHVLLAMKLAWLPTRGEPHKKVKDLADMVALLAQGTDDPAGLLGEARDPTTARKARAVILALGNDEWDAVARISGVSLKAAQALLYRIGVPDA